MLARLGAAGCKVTADGDRLISRLRAAGLNIRADGTRLIVEPKKLLTDALAAEIRANKLQLLHELAAESRPRPQFPAWTRPRYVDRPRRRAYRW